MFARACQAATRAVAPAPQIFAAVSHVQTITPASRMQAHVSLSENGEQSGA
jgi:hypothetical protein